MWNGGSHRLGRRLWDAGLRIDDFSVPGRLYLLSHFHSDHMRGLRQGDPGAPVVLSPQTALLATKIKRLPPQGLITLAPGESVRLEAPVPLRIQALEANHCPGALMFLIECDGGRMLYTGDFRFDEQMRDTIRRLPAVDVLVADNTYDHPRYLFPPQTAAIDKVVSLVQRLSSEREVAIAVYSIGKTRIIEAIRERLGLRTYVGAKTARIYSILGLGDLVTRDKEETPLRGYGRGYFDTYFKRKRDYRLGRLVAIIPTGWAVDVRRPEWNFHYVPYSEHCDYHERADFVAALRPGVVECLLEDRDGPSTESIPQGGASQIPLILPSISETNC